MKAYYEILSLIHSEFFDYQFVITLLQEEEGAEEEVINAIPLEEILPTVVVASVVKKAIGAMNALTLQITATNVEKKVIFPANAPREGLTSALVVAKKAIKRESAPTNQSLIAIIAVKRAMVLENVLRILVQVEEIEVRLTY